MDEATSHRVKLLRFPLILLVLYIHSYIAPVTLGRNTIAVVPNTAMLAFQHALTGGIARTAVPLFFLMSGYLYFVGFDGSLVSYRVKTARRIGTLLVPFLFWNLLIIVLFALGQSLTQTAGLFNAVNGRVLDATIFGFANMLMGITRYPMAYQFWFIRDLMVIALMAPVIHWSIARTGPLLPAMLIAWWLLGLPWVALPAIDGLGFFTLGAWLAQSGRPLFPAAGSARWLVPAYIIVLAVDITLRITLGWMILYSYSILLGAAMVLAVTACMTPGTAASRLLATLAPASFFVFAAHEPLMTMLRKAIYRTLPTSQTTIFATYTLLPAILGLALVAAYFASIRIAPRFIGIISGGR